MECIPPFGWHEIATKRDLTELEQRLDLRFDAKLHVQMNRVIRWTVASVFGGISALSAVAAAVAALLS